MRQSDPNRLACSRFFWLFYGEYSMKSQALLESLIVAVAVLLVAFGLHGVVSASGSCSSTITNGSFSCPAGAQCTTGICSAKSFSSGPFDYTHCSCSWATPPCCTLTIQWLDALPLDAFPWGDCKASNSACPPGNDCVLVNHSNSGGTFSADDVKCEQHQTPL